jgi:hypothetical protein
MSYDPAKAVEYFRNHFREHCGGCGATGYSGEKTYVVCSLHGTDFSAWLCTACAERLHSQAATFMSMGSVVQLPLPSEEKP